MFPDRVSSGYCLQAVRRHAPATARSILDLGCGTGSTLAAVRQSIPDCVGVDRLPAMIAHGRRARPGLDLRVGDVRTIRLERTFDVIGSFGWAFSYLLDDDDLEGFVSTCAAHAHPGTLLLLDAGQAAAYLGMADPLPPVEMRMNTPEFRATAVSTFTLDRGRRLLRRRRTWTLEDGSTREDVCTYRLHDEEPLRRVLARGGFRLIECAGDPSGRPLAPGERTLFCTAARA